MTIIKIERVFKTYNNKSILKNLDFKINKNEYVGLIGNNGVGKTTTLKIICNLINFNGSLSVNEKLVSLNDYKFRSKFGIIFDDSILIDDFSVIDYFIFLNKIFEVDNFRSKLNELLFRFGIQDKIKAQINNLSSGERMKLLFISSLFHNPSILIYDEPFINIDIQTTEKFINILKSFKEKKTLLITSHNLDLVADLCDRFLVMESGKIVMELHKSDYTNLSDLKKVIKERITDSNCIKDISWLN